MKKYILSLTLAVLTIVSASAQINGDGYYRVMNNGLYNKGFYGYLCITYKNAKLNMAAGTAQNIEPIAIWAQEETGHSDPAAVLYISDPFSPSGCNIQSQGVSMRSLFSGTMTLSGNHPQYKIQATISGQSALIYASAKKVMDHYILTGNVTSGHEYWRVYPVDNTRQNNWFGVKPTLQANGKYYAPYYVSFPFETESEGMKVYSVSEITNDSYTLKEIKGIVPAATPVLIECSSPNSIDNKLKLYKPGTAGVAVGTNKLSGNYFFNEFLDVDKNPEAIVPFNDKTMRVWAVENGNLVLTNKNVSSNPAMKYSEWDEVYCLSPNSSYVMLAASEQTTTAASLLPKSAAKTATITFNTDGGTAVSSITANEGSTITPPANPTKTGYDFAGWNPALPETMPVNGMTTTAQWTPKNYTLTYKVDGSVTSTQSVAFGTSITPLTAPTKTGYTFSGWSEIPQTMPASDVTVTGSFAVNTYKLKYVVDGSEVQSSDVAYGASITPLTAPTKTGYTFSGWSEIPQTMPASDVTVTGSFTVNTYKLKYLVDGNEVQSSDVAYGTSITPLTAPTKTGYTFSGWSEIPQTMPASDVTVTGSFAVNTYKLKYVVDGSEVQSSDVAYGVSITPLTAPTKTGYTFGGWSQIPQTMPASDVTVTGTFTVNTYKLKYLVDGNEVQSSDVAYGTSITPLTAPTKTGYTFSGWSEIPQTMPATDVTVTGSFAVNTYKLKYIVDGSEVQSSDVAYGASITPLTAPTKTGYTFGGWSEIPQTMPASDVTVSGSFTINQYTVTFISNGETVKSETLNYGEPITAPADPTKTGSKFLGWSPSVDATVPNHDVTYTASFDDNLQFAITYKVDGEVFFTQSLPYESTITPIDAPTKTGYTFSGWSEIPRTMPASDVTVTGSFTVNNYKLTYLVDGKETQSSEVAYGTSITPLTAPTKTGYTFSGWSEIPQTMPASDVTVTGSFAVNKYKLAYIVDGKETQSSEVAFGTTITPLTAPTKTGYTFSGWSEIPQTMPASDVTVTGTFSVNQYTITFNTNNGTTVADIKADYGSPINKPADPTKPYFTFKGWDKELPETMPLGGMTLNAQWEKAAVELTMQLEKGWNWISLGVENNKFNSLATAFPSTAWATGDEIKTNNQLFAYSGQQHKWLGTQSDLRIDNLSMLKINVTEPRTIKVEGTILIPSETPLTINHGWNYIAYLPVYPMNITEALGNYAAQRGDIIKSQGGSAIYDGTSWTSSDVRTLEPGKGYMLYRTATASVSFRYPDVPVEKNVAGSKAQGTFLYADNMNVIGTVEGLETQEGDSIIAIANGEVRGVAAVNSADATLLTISGEETEPIIFAISRCGEIIGTSDESISFHANAINGTLDAPTVISFSNGDGKMNIQGMGNVTDIYTLDGMKTSQIRRGVNILRTDNGTVKVNTK